MDRHVAVVDSNTTTTALIHDLSNAAQKCSAVILLYCAEVRSSSGISDVDYFLYAALPIAARATHCTRLSLSVSPILYCVPSPIPRHKKF